jgi:hypothetical protein
MTAIFAGPSLYGVDLSPFKNFEFRPPAKAGDIFNAVQQGQQTIGLIDGVFEGSLSVWHKEILYALSKNIRVFGAASMGALRAAECHSFGMIGIGKIFGDYHNGDRTSDADVAVLHAPQELGYKPLSLALVDVEEKLKQDGSITKMEAENILSAARSIHFKERTWDQIFTQLPNAQHIKTRLQQDLTSQKTTDAVLLLQHISNLEEACGKPIHFIFNNTVFLESLRSRNH